jgi:hypothetical protein
MDFFEILTCYSSAKQIFYFQERNKRVRALSFFSLFCFRNIKEKNKSGAGDSQSGAHLCCLLPPEEKSEESLEAIYSDGGGGLIPLHLLYPFIYLSFLILRRTYTYRNINLTSSYLSLSTAKKPI